MKICPSCSARLGDDASVCSSCEYRFDSESSGSSPSVKKTMMGLPALTDYQSMAKKTTDAHGNPQDLGKSPVGSTLFGLPALNFADAFSESSEVSEASTSMISATDLKKALSPEFRSTNVGHAAVKDQDDDAEVGGPTTSTGMAAPVLGAGKGKESESSGKPASDAAKMTAFGMRAPTLAELESAGGMFAGFGDEQSVHPEDPWVVEEASQRLTGERVSEAADAFRGWGLAEETSDEAAHTAVASAEDLQRGGFGGKVRNVQAIGFGAEEYPSTNHTIMGMAVDSEVFQDQKPSQNKQGGQADDATRAVNPAELFGGDFGATGVEDVDGLQNILDKVRSDTLSRQTTSLNVPSVTSTPASGLVRIRPEAAQASRAMMSTPVMNAEPELGAEADGGANENQTAVLSEAPASGVFKKLKRRLAVGAAGAEANEDGGLTGAGVYQMGAAGGEQTAVREAPFVDLQRSPKALSLAQTSVLKSGSESSDVMDLGGSSLSSMADELASIPAMSDDFAGLLNIPESFEVAADPVQKAESVADVAEPVLTGAAVTVRELEAPGLLASAVAAKEIAAPETAASVGVVQAPPADVESAHGKRAGAEKAVQESAGVQKAVAQGEAGLSGKVKLAILLVVAVVVIGFVLVLLN